MEQFFSYQGVQHPNEVIQIIPALREYSILPPQTPFLGLVLILGGLFHKSISRYLAMVSFPDPNNCPVYFPDLLLRVSIPLNSTLWNNFFCISQIGGDTSELKGDKEILSTNDGVMILHSSPWRVQWTYLPRRPAVHQHSSPRSEGFGCSPQTRVAARLP